MGEGVSVDDTLHGWFPFHTHQVSCLATVVDQHITVKVCLAQESHIHKRH